MHSKPALPITTAELRQAWRRAGLWRIGTSFEAALQAPLVRWSMEHQVLAARRAGRTEAQLRLI